VITGLLPVNRQLEMPQPADRDTGGVNLLTAKPEYLSEDG
jgi:hypothetical protein